MKNGFWDQFESGFTCLAPMEGVTDIVFRQVVIRAGRPDIFFTEFTNVSSYASEQGRPNAVARLKFLPEEMPIVAQIWGTNPEHFEITSRGLKEMGYTAVDLNMGCPEKNVVRNGGGSGLIRTPELAAQIIESTKKSGLEVSVKTRLGYSRPEEWRDWLTFVLRQDVVALTIHLRTKKEMSKVDAHFELVPDIIALRDEVAPHTKLIINGDIKSSTDGQRFIEMGADGVMIGRGVFADPYCFAKDALLRDPVGLLQYHLDLFDEHGLGTFEPLKRFFKIYINNFPGASEVRERLMVCKNTQAVRDILSELEEMKK
jgi:tRNA-dihydrouridine synthase